jgi:predicted nucleic acid-binding protein
MKYVLDASVAFKWEVPELNSDKAIRLRDESRAGLRELIAPDFFPVEVAHSMTRAERQGRISPSDGWRLWLGIMADAPILHPYLPLMARAYALSSSIRHGVYDCLYIALAEREGCELVTADDKLVKNLRATFPLIVSLDSMPCLAWHDRECLSPELLSVSDDVISRAAGSETKSRVVAQRK